MSIPSYKPIRSYVRRESRMSPAQKKALIDFWPQYGIDFSKTVINLQTIFQNNHPVILEIGFGMGQSFLEIAIANPTRNFIGIEVHRPGVGSLLSQLAKANIKNVRLFCHDAVEVLTDCIPPHSIDQFHIFFPDPWPKKRHHKRRLIQTAFVNLLIDRLKPNGLIHAATDWQDYAEHMMMIFSEISALENVAGPGHFSEPATRPKTKFEIRGKKLGHDVWDLMFRLIA